MIYLNGLPLVSLNLTVGQSGPVEARVVFSEESDFPPTDDVRDTLTVGSTSIVGTFIGGMYQGERKGRFVGGAGGWATKVGALPYHSDAGVKLSNVLTGLAGPTGETFDLTEAGDRRVGNDFVRPADRASTILGWLVGNTWWVDFDGVTHVVARAARTPDESTYRVLSYNPQREQASLDVDDPFSVMVGDTIKIEGEDRIVRTLIVDVVGETLTVKAWVGGDENSVSPEADLIAKIFGAQTRKRYGVYRYRFVKPDGVRGTFQPVNSTDVPTLSACEIWTAPGISADLTAGVHCGVMFLDGDINQPIVMCVGGAYQEGHEPALVNVGGIGGSPIASVGDTVNVYLPASIPFSGLYLGLPITGVMTPLQGATGVIQGGSTKASVKK